MDVNDIRLAAVLDVMAEGVLVLDVDCRIVLWNMALERLTGWAASSKLGRPGGDVVCADADAGGTDCPLLAAVGGRPVVSGVECSLRTRTGERVPVLKNARLLRDADGEPAGAVITVTDLRPLRRLEHDLAEVRGQTAAAGFGRLVGRSGPMRAVYERLRLAAESNATVLLLGETGTGKELAAEAIHSASARADGPFVKVNCAALPESLLESELFGHVRGAFTGAASDKIGRFEAADGGTILLDEIGDLSPFVQLKLLRVLQERTIERVGDSVPRRIDVRVICATHRDLRERVGQGEFREDLYYRIRVFPIDLPPMRHRKADIPVLVNTFIARYNRQTGKHITGIDEDVLHCFMEHCWPGNVRELENAIEHAFVVCRGGDIRLRDLPAELRHPDLRAAYCRDRWGRDPQPAADMATASSAADLRRILEECGWNRSEAARRLGIHRTTLWRRCHQLGIRPPK